MQMEEMVAGRELDALVAEKVMGETHIAEASSFVTALRQRNGRTINHIEPLRRYSTDIAAAWQVLDAMVWRVGTANIRLDMEDYGRGAMSDQGAERAVWVTIGEWTVCGPAPLAICQAALAAVASAE